MTAAAEPVLERSRSAASCRMLIVEQGEGVWGAQRYLLRLAPLLEDRGVEQVLAAPAGSATAAAWVEEGRRHVVLDSPDERAMRSASGRVRPDLVVREAGRMLSVARRTAVLAREVGADVLHANSHWSHAEAVVAGRLARLPVILHLHEESEPDLLGKMRALPVLAADASIAVSQAVARSLPARVAGRPAVIRNGIDADLLQPGLADPEVKAQLTDDPASPVLLTLSRLDPLKGVDQVIRAVAALPAELGVRLAIAGAPSLAPEHGELLRRLGRELLGDRVRFLGPRTDVADLLRAADALVLASALEGLPLSILEAQACGTPVVAYPTAGVPEVVTHEDTGLLARPGDVADLSAQLERLARDPELRVRLRRAGRERVLAESTLAGQADQQVELLGEVLRRRERA